MAPSLSKPSLIFVTGAAALGAFTLYQYKLNAKASLYERLGGDAAVDAAVDAFYVKVLADDRISHFFTKIDMTKQREQQKKFLTVAFGGPSKYKGNGMRCAHARFNLKEEHFNAVAENLVETLQELGVQQAEIDDVVAVCLSVKDEVLNK